MSRLTYSQSSMGHTNFGSKDGCVIQEWTIRELKDFIPMITKIKLGVGMWLSRPRKVIPATSVKGIWRDALFFSWTISKSNQCRPRLNDDNLHHFMGRMKLILKN